MVNNVSQFSPLSLSSGAKAPHGGTLRHPPQCSVFIALLLLLFLSPVVKSSAASDRVLVLSDLRPAIVSYMEQVSLSSPYDTYLNRISSSSDSLSLVFYSGYMFTPNFIQCSVPVDKVVVDTTSNFIYLYYQGSQLSRVDIRRSDGWGYNSSDDVCLQNWYSNAYFRSQWEMLPDSFVYLLYNPNIEYIVDNVIISSPVDIPPDNEDVLSIWDWLTYEDETFSGWLEYTINFWKNRKGNKQPSPGTIVSDPEATPLPTPTPIIQYIYNSDGSIAYSYEIINNDNTQNIVNNVTNNFDNSTVIQEGSSYLYEKEIGDTSVSYDFDLDISSGVSEMNKFVYESGEDIQAVGSIGAGMPTSFMAYIAAGIALLLIAGIIHRFLG